MDLYLVRHGVAFEQDATRWPDPSLRASEMVHAEPRRLCTQLREVLGAGRGARGASAHWLAGTPDG